LIREGGEVKTKAYECRDCGRTYHRMAPPLAREPYRCIACWQVYRESPEYRERVRMHREFRAAQRGGRA
jgi:hypothetical protein